MTARIVFMGTPEFAVPPLAALAERFHVVGVVTQPDKPTGRGQQLAPPPVKEGALQHGLPVFQPRTLRDAAVQAQLAELAPDVIVVAAFGLLLPPNVLDLPPHGCINVHASLLPKYRGAAPIPAAILNGEAVTGITLMRMDAGLDTGPLLAQASIEIGAGETSTMLSARLAELGAQILIESLPRWLAGEIVPRPQDDAQATLAPKFGKQDGRIDWMGSAVELDRRVRAFTPWPGTFTTWKGKLLRVNKAQATESGAQEAAGRVIQIQDGWGVATGNGILRLIEVQLEGKRPMKAEDFARGQPSFVGSVLGE